MTDERHSKLNRYVLDNGLPVIIDERPLSDTVFCAIYVRVGSRYETKRNNGISHFLEHLLFREKGAAPTVRQIEDTGGSVNGMTTFEYTNYFFDTLASEFEEAWDGLYRLVCEPSFGEQEVELERKIILREVAGGKSNPLAIAYYAAVREFLPNTSLAMPIPGTRRSLKRISFQEIREFYDTHYVPNNMFVVIAGGVETESALEAVRRTFGESTADQAPPRQFALPPRQEKRHELKLKTLVDQGYMGIGVRTDGDKDEHKYEMKLIDVVMGSGRNSRIYKELKMKRGITDFIVSVADMSPVGGAALSDIGFWGVAVGTAPKHLSEAEHVVETEMRRMKTEPLAVDELETARSRVLGRFAIACETNSGRAGFYTATELAGEFMSLDEHKKRIEAVTPQSMAQAAIRKFDDKEVMLLDVRPAKGVGKVVAIARYFVFIRK